MDILYQARATATGGRTGTAIIDDGAMTLSLATPRELGGPGGEGTNPEQLFASVDAACLLGALRIVARRRKHGLSDDSSVTATVGTGPRADGPGLGLDVALAVNLPGQEPQIEQELVEAAHAACPYSHLSREGVAVRLTLA
jgi:Ohr subfamily peroxiredoxin